MLQAWNRIPVLFRSIAIGFLAAAAGTIPWAAFFAANVKFAPVVPWSIVPGVAWLWLWWKYFSGHGPPLSTSAARKKSLRANPLRDDVWTGAIGAGVLATITFVVFLGVLNRLVRMPPQALDDGEKSIPALTMFFGIILGSIVAGVVEEGAFRGYMQGPIERRHGPTVAILVTGIVFTFAHATHSYFALVLLPYYLAVATMYGSLAYVTNSILPGIFLHAGLDIMGGLQTLTTGRAEWLESPRPLVWESGLDVMFLLSTLATLILGGLTIAAYRSVAKMTRTSTTPTP